VAGVRRSRVGGSARPSIVRRRVIGCGVAGVGDPLRGWRQIEHCSKPCCRGHVADVGGGACWHGLGVPVYARGRRTAA
jgi:hypothetical protein